jgi:predicted NAD/FAD-binding protein
VVISAHVTQDVRDVLSAIPYNENNVWLHTDATLMPRNRTAWASWNFLGRCKSFHIERCKPLARANAHTSS